MGLSTAICGYLLAKHLVKSQKERLSQEIFQYLASPEGQQSLRNLGTIFAQGIAKGMGFGDSALKGKTFGISNRVLVPILDRLMGGKTEEAKSKDAEVTTKSEKFG